MKNIFTIDWEEWYHANYNGICPASDRRDCVTAPTHMLLELLAAHGCRSTFFVVGELALRHRDLIQQIDKAGHELASHSYAHELVYSQTRPQFREDLIRSIDTLASITGKPPLGYRAPSWSVSMKKTPWFWETLAECGFLYSSSRMPFKTFLYGDEESPLAPHKIDGVLEVPASVVNFGRRRIAFSGGFYLRAFPLVFVESATKRCNRAGRPVVFYMHPREIDPTQPKIPGLSRLHSFIHYYNIPGTRGKVSKLLYTFPTIPLLDYALTLKGSERPGDGAKDRPNPAK